MRIDPRARSHGSDCIVVALVWLSGCYRAVAPADCGTRDSCDAMVPSDDALPVDVPAGPDAEPMPHTVLSIALRTGHDDLRSDSALDAIVVSTDGSSRSLVLRAAGQPAWLPGDTNTFTTDWGAASIASITLRLIESDPGCSVFCDNWDVASIDAALVGSDGSRVCIVDRVGPNGGADDDADAVVRLEAREAGGFSDQMTFASGTGCL